MESWPPQDVNRVPSQMGRRDGQGAAGRDSGAELRRELHSRRCSRLLALDSALRSLT